MLICWERTQSRGDGVLSDLRGSVESPGWSRVRCLQGSPGCGSTGKLTLRPRPAAVSFEAQALTAGVTGPQ